MKTYTNEGKIFAVTYSAPDDPQLYQMNVYAASEAHALSIFKAAEPEAEVADVDEGEDCISQERLPHGHMNEEFREDDVQEAVNCLVNAISEAFPQNEKGQVETQFAVPILYCALTDVFRGMMLLKDERAKDLTAEEVWGVFNRVINEMVENEGGSLDPDGEPLKF